MKRPRRSLGFLLSFGFAAAYNAGQVAAHPHSPWFPALAVGFALMFIWEVVDPA